MHDKRRAGEDVAALLANQYPPVMTMTADIRRARPDEAAALAKLKRDSFRETFLEGGFAIPYPPNELAAFERDSYDIDVIADELADGRKACWVADGGGRLLGYAQVGYCKLPHPDARPEHGELYQLYVLREAQGLRLGGRLLAVALEYLAENRPGPVWLGVWSGNVKAQQVYSAKGFVKVGDYRYRVGRDWYDDEYIFRRD